jgi:hypothetical protein
MKKHPDYSPHSPHDDTETHPGYHSDNHAYNEEMGAELGTIAPGYSGKYADRDLVKNARHEAKSTARAIGWAALVLAILSWLMWPVLLGATAAVVGFMAFRQGARGLGVWSITLGLIALASYLVLIPIYYAIT